MSTCKLPESACEAMRSLQMEASAGTILGLEKGSQSRASREDHFADRIGQQFLLVRVDQQPHYSPGDRLCYWVEVRSTDYRDPEAGKNELVRRIKECGGNMLFDLQHERSTGRRVNHRLTLHGWRAKAGVYVSRQRIGEGQDPSKVDQGTEQQAHDILQRLQSLQGTLDAEKWVKGWIRILGLIVVVCVLMSLVH